MRIAIFTETFVPKVDGIVTTLCQTVKHLNRLGHEVLIFAPDTGVQTWGPSRIVGMKGRSFRLYPELMLALPRPFIRSVLSEFNPDIIHAADPALLGVAALYYGGGELGGSYGAPLVVSYHTDLPSYLNFYGLRILQPIIWKLLQIRHGRANLNLCTSTVMVSQLQQHDIERVALWPGGVDVERFQPQMSSREMRQRLTQGEVDRPLLLYVGRLSAEKEIERLKLVLDGLPGARLALVGDGPHRGALEKHFSGLPVVMTGFLHGEDLATAFASSDFFVMPSRTETLGLVVLEAMASGLAVVAARAGGIPELIEEGVDGYLFDTEAEAIATIQQLLAVPEKLASLRDRARKTALDHSWEAATNNLVAHYHLVCEKFRAANDQPVLAAHKRREKRTKGNITAAIIHKLLQ